MKKFDKDTEIKVVNRSSGMVGYSVSDLGVSRIFQPKESKDISYHELQKLSQENGGRYLLEHELLVQDIDALRQILNIQVEPEYMYTEKEVDDLLLKGSIAQLKDCLDFAPDGVLSLVKDRAVALKLNDMSKREAIKEALEFDVTSAIEINKETETDTTETPQRSQRRAPVFTESASDAPVTTSKRRTEAPAYKIISEQQ